MSDTLILKKSDRDDYLVIRDGQMAGSIHRVFRPVPEPWRWKIDSSYGDQGGWSATLDDAKAAFRMAWDELEMIPVYKYNESD